MTLDTQMTLALPQQLLMALGGYGLFFYFLIKVADFSQCLLTESSLIKQQENLKPNVHPNHMMRS